eukprot:3412787-Rhodomonas_salina.1
MQATTQGSSEPADQRRGAEGGGWTCSGLASEAPCGGVLEGVARLGVEVEQRPPPAHFRQQQRPALRVRVHLAAQHEVAVR